MKLSDGEKLIIMMLCELYEKTGVDGEIDPKFVRSTIHSGNEWGLRWEYPGIFSAEPVAEDVRKTVVDALDMWQFLEESYDRLPTKEQNRVDGAVGPWKGVRFKGFDGNNEADYLNVLAFLIDDLNRWQHFNGRSLNSHMPTVPTYHRMFVRFEPIRASLGPGGGGLTADQIIDVLTA